MDILLVEDSAAEARLLRDVLMETNPKVRLHVVYDGVEAMAFLRYQGAYLYVPRPDLILLDLNMPKKDGRSVLAEVKADPRLKTIPLIVLTSSQAEFDIQQSYKLLASCYVVKPLNVMELVKSLNEFWLSRVKFRKRVTDTTPT